MAVDPMMLAAGPAMPDAPLPPGLGGAPPMGLPVGPPGGGTPAEMAMQMLMGLVPAQQAQQAQLEQAQTMQVQDVVMQMLGAQPNPLGMGAVTGPVAPGGLEGAQPAADGAAEGEAEAY